MQMFIVCYKQSNEPPATSGVEYDPEIPSIT
jgi:hypothetical protein